MSDTGWEHIILAAIAAIPATIAAVSSVRNGRVLKNGYGNGATKKGATVSGGYPPRERSRNRSDWHQPKNRS